MAVELHTFKGTRGNLQTYATTGDLTAMVLDATVVDWQDEAIVNITDVNANEITDAGTYTPTDLTGVDWDTTSAIPALVADDLTIEGLDTAEAGHVVIYHSSGALVLLVKFDPMAVVGDLPIEWPGGKLADLSESIDESFVPPGGTTGQALLKASNTDGDTEWGDVSGGGGGTAAVEVAVFATDVDMAGGSFSNIPLANGSGGTIPRSSLVGQKVAVISGDDFGVWTITSSGACTAVTLAPWDQIIGGIDGLQGVATTADGTTVNGVKIAWNEALVNAEVDALAATVSALDADDIDFTGSGLMALAGNVGYALREVEGAFDGQRDVSTFFASAVPDLATLMAGPVADIDQPTGDDGRQVQKGDFVATLGDVDVDGNGWIHVVDIDTGQWGEVPSGGASTPVGASSWDNALTTNPLRGGDTIVLASGAIGTFRVNRTNGVDTWARGGPGVFASAYADGEWVFTAPGGAGGSVSSVNGNTGTVVLDADDIADGTTNKAYTATEKTKLAGIASGATANSSDATLLDRANHTGTQAQSTITNLATDLTLIRSLSRHTFVSGSYTPVLTGSATTITAVNERLYLGNALDLYEARTFDRIGVYHASGLATTGTIRMALYSATSGGTPGALYQDLGATSVDATAGAASFKYVSGTFALPAGRYFVGVVVQGLTGTAPVFTAVANIFPVSYPSASSDAPNLQPIQASVSGSAPDPAAPSGGSNTMPVAYVRSA